MAESNDPDQEQPEFEPEPEPVEIDWEAGAPPAEQDPGTIEQATLALVAAGVAPASLSQLHEQGFTPGTPADTVPPEIWQDILGTLTPKDAATVAQLNTYFHHLIHQGPIPLADTQRPDLVHVYNPAQLATAATLAGMWGIAVHAGIDAAVVGATAATTATSLYLAPGVSASGITGGAVYVHDGGTATNITRGTVIVREGGRATNITGGEVNVWDGGTATGITSGTVDVNGGGMVTGITGGTVDVYYGGTATNITGGTVTVLRGGTVRVPAEVELTDGGRGVFFNGVDPASSTLVITLRGGGRLERG